MDAEAGKTVVNVLANVLQKLVAANDKTSKSNQVTKFHALRPPSISVQDYLDRIRKYASCSAECFVLALVYIDRLIQHAGLVVSSLNIHRVVITSVMLAAKYFDDHYYNNAYYAKIGGVPCTEMNSLELEFLFLINFTLYVQPESYTKYHQELCSHAYMVGVGTVPYPPSAPWAMKNFTGTSSNTVAVSPDNEDDAMVVETPSLVSNTETMVQS